MGGCPECGDKDVECVRQDSDDSGYEYEEYECTNCGCVFAWEMKRIVIEHGEVQDEAKC